MIVSALMNVNPVMIYSGQEYGERGMDYEGYSGIDGRTTIYDYWSPLKIRKALFYPQELTEEEKELKEFYTVLLSIQNILLISCIRSCAKKEKNYFL